MPRGKLFTLEGPTSTGKDVQTNLLCARFMEEGEYAYHISFPQYGEDSAWLAERYLSGKEEEPVSPRQAALYFSVDRLNVTDKINTWVSHGAYIVANRYTASSAGHLGAQLKTFAERQRFYHWLWEVEYTRWNIPRPALNFLLLAPPEVIFRLRVPAAESFETSEMKNLELELACYREVAALFPREFVIIDSASHGHMLSREEIHEKIWTHIKDSLPHPIVGT